MVQRNVFHGKRVLVDDQITIAEQSGRYNLLARLEIDLGSDHIGRA